MRFFCYGACNKGNLKAPIKCQIDSLLLFLWYAISLILQAFFIVESIGCNCHFNCKESIGKITYSEPDPGLSNFSIFIFSFPLLAIG